ncbi:MAG: hypothetical protein HKN82_15915 [Akkermansiaceae bacterium]|nr:hypothetical protein [Akkermansiaceae bacterium]
MKKRTLLTIALAAIAIPSLSNAQITNYAQDFEGLTQSDPDALGNDGWNVFGVVFDPSGTTELYNYAPACPCPAPNNPAAPAFSLITAGEGGPDQGAQGLVAFSDYQNGDHRDGSNNLIESILFQEQTIALTDVDTYSFTFDAKAGDLASPSTAEAFIRVVDPADGSIVFDEVLDLTSLPVTWGTYSLDIAIDGAFDEGFLLQFGFSIKACCDNPSGVQLDNVSFGLPPDPPGLEDYCQDFESYDNSTVTALGDDGWLVFGNVFDSTGGYLYGYGTNPAPNNVDAAAFSLITTGEGGAEQGAQGLVVFSDYQNGDHDATICNLIEANVFQERVITNGDFGRYQFQFDAKRGDLAGTSTAKAFIKILNPNTGFSLTTFKVIETSNLPVEWMTYTISVDVDGVALAGQILQFGFLNTASKYEPSGVQYDNVKFTKISSELGGLEAYSQNFETLTQASGSALSDDGWIVFGNVFDPAGVYRYGYGTFPAPNNLPPGANFSYVWSSEGGAAQGNQGIAILGDYNNTDQDAGGLNSTVEANTFQEQKIASSDSGTWCFQFDAKGGDISGNSTALAFVKVLDPANNFSLSEFLTVDTTNLPATWDRYSIKIDIDGSVLGGQLLQFGFLTQTNNFEPSTVFYDNINFGLVVETPQFEIVNITKTGNQADITFQSEAGVTYSLLSSTTLNGLGSFTPVAGQTSIAGTGGEVVASDTAASETFKAYVVQENP